MKMYSVRVVNVEPGQDPAEAVIAEQFDERDELCDRIMTAEEARAAFTARTPEKQPATGPRRRKQTPEEHISWTIAELESWRETFDNEGDEPGDRELGRLIKALEAGTYTKKDLENVLFHLWQQKGGQED